MVLFTHIYLFFDHTCASLYCTAKSFKVNKSFLWSFLHEKNILISLIWSYLLVWHVMLSIITVRWFINIILFSKNAVHKQFSLSLATTSKALTSSILQLETGKGKNKYKFNEKILKIRISSLRNMWLSSEWRPTNCIIENIIRFILER